MNRLLILGLIGGGVYWLFKEAARRNEEAALAEATLDFEDALSDTGLDPYDEDGLLDEALDDSFPASDPAAPATHRRPA